MPKAATTGEDVEDGPTGLEDSEGELVSEARETNSVNLGKWKQQEKKPSEFLFVLIISYCSTSVRR